MVLRGCRDVDDVARRYGPILEDAGRLAGQQRVDDGGDTALGGRGVGRPAEQTLDPQHVAARCVSREPLAEQLRHRVDAQRIDRIVFHVRAIGGAVEDEITAEVDERGTARGAGQRTDGDRVGAHGLDGMILRRVHERCTPRSSRSRRAGPRRWRRSPRRRRSGRAPRGRTPRPRAARGRHGRPLRRADRESRAPQSA